MPRRVSSFLAGERRLSFELQGDNQTKNMYRPHRTRPGVLTLLNRNVIFTFISSICAGGLTLLTVPVYLGLIGAERYGVLAFVWLIIGYFGIFILGLDKAITNLLSQHRHDPEAARSLFQTAMLLNLLTSCAGGMAVYFVGYQVLARTMSVDDVLRDEILHAMPWIAASVPLATTTALLIGTLEAFERFPTLASTQLSATVLFQVVPILVAWLIGPQLTWVIPAAILTRACSTIWMMILLKPILRFNARIPLQFHWVAPLLRYGGSISLSGIAAPILTSLDRVIIGAALGAAAVSYYVVPFSLVSAAQLVPGSLLRVLFPRLSTLAPAAAHETSIKATLTLGAILTPLIAFGILFARPLMTFWLGMAFAHKAQGIAEILLHGAWINCLAWAPSTLLLSQGRPGLVARLHLIEVTPFVALVWFGVWLGGIHGAAVASSMRMWADALLLFHVSRLGPAIARPLACPSALITLALVASLSLSWTSPTYLLLSSTIEMGCIAWSISQISLRQRNRLLAFRPKWPAWRRTSAAHGTSTARASRWRPLQ